MKGEMFEMVCRLTDGHVHVGLLGNSKVLHKCVCMLQSYKYHVNTVF